MKPSEIYQRTSGDVEPLPDALREALLSSGSAATPGLPPRKTHKTGRATRDRSHAGLTDKQKAVVCQLAATAFAFQRKHGLIEEGVKLEAWRRAEQLAAVGVDSLTKCRQSHYRALRGHFEALAGKQGAGQLRDLTAGPDDPYRQAMGRALREELFRFAGLDDGTGRLTGPHRAEAYLLAIAKHRATVAPVSVAQIVETWPPEKVEGLVFTMRNRVAKRARG